MSLYFCSTPCALCCADSSLLLNLVLVPYSLPYFFPFLYIVFSGSSCSQPCLIPSRSVSKQKYSLAGFPSSILLLLSLDPHPFFFFFTPARSWLMLPTPHLLCHYQSCCWSCTSMEEMANFSWRSHQPAPEVIDWRLVDANFTCQLNLSAGRQGDSDLCLISFGLLCNTADRDNVRGNAVCTHTHAVHT